LLNPTAYGALNRGEQPIGAGPLSSAKINSVSDSALPSVMRYLLAFLALAGIVISTMALRIHYSTATEPCSINEHWDCGIVNHSSFSVLFHVPVAAIGIAGYLALGILALARLRGLHLAAAVVGLAFALHLTSIERNVLQVWCLYCVISQGIIALITVLSIIWFIAHRISKSRTLKAA
jgi:vitamin-K-epoxide reductase (warfarin-sensitive)